MIICPNKNLKSWKDLVKAVGEDRALLSFIRNGSVIPTIEQAQELASNKALLESQVAISSISEKILIKEMSEAGIINENITKNISGTKYYFLTDKDELEFISDKYGPIILTQGDYISINPDAVKAWNKVASSTKGLTLEQINRRFLSNIGVSVITQDDLIEKYGVNEVADFSEMMIRLQRGEEQALTEEALHFFIEMLPQDMPELVEALNQTMNSKLYKSVLNSYSNRKEYRTSTGKIRYDKIQKEVLAKELVKILEGETSPFKSFFDGLLSWIQNKSFSKSSKDIIAEMYLSGDISNLNRNLNSHEVFLQLSDKEKHFYETQGMNENQRNTLEKIIANTSNLVRDGKRHIYKVSMKEPDGTISYKDIPYSVTAKLGSDFHSELDKPEVLFEIVNSFLSYYPEALKNPDFDVQNKQIIDSVIDDILVGKLDSENIKNFLSDEKLINILFKSAEARRKTIFGTAIHDIAQAIIYNRDLSDIKVDSRIIDENTLKNLIYGNIDQPGILGLIKSLKKDGKILMTEIQISNFDNSIGGEFDLITIDKNGVVDIYDFKTKYMPPHKSNSMPLHEEFKVVASILSSTPVKNEPGVFPELVGTRRSNLEKYTQQLSIYKRMLMEMGIPVSTINVIGIPYRMVDGKISNITTTLVRNLKYNSNLGNVYFKQIDDNLDHSNNKSTSTQEDARFDTVVKIPKITLKKTFVKALERINELYESYKKSESGKKLYNILAESEDSNTLARIKSLTKNTLDNISLDQDIDNISKFTTVQRNFLEILDGSSIIIDKVVNEFERLRRLHPQDSQAAAQRLQELGKINNFLIGYQKMFDEINKTLGIVDQDNLIVKEVSKMMGAINQVQSLYIETILPDIISTLNDAFTPELVSNIKREYLELISAARERKDSKLEKSLLEEMSKLPNEEVLKATLKGEHGDIGQFFGKFIAAISNPDVVISGVAKKLKATLDRVRLINKDLKDRFSNQFDSRRKTFGTKLNIKEFNQSLVDVVTRIDPKTGVERKELVLKSEFDESIYYEQNKLKNEIIKASTPEDRIKAVKALREFEVKYLQTDRTREYYDLVKILDKVVTYNGEKTTIDDIRKNIFSSIRIIQNKYHEEDLMSDEDIEEVNNLLDEYYQLGNINYLDGTRKTGDDLIIANTLEQWRDISKDIFEEIEMKGMFEKRSNLVKLKYGEDSQEYLDWYSRNTREVVSDDYYKYVENIFDQISNILGKKQDLSDKYKHLRSLYKAFKDKDGTVDGTIISEERIKQIYDLELALLSVSESNNTSYSLLTDDEKEHLSELFKTLSSIRNTSTTKYYQDELERQIRIFAEVNNVTYEEIKKDNTLYEQFKQSDWYLRNHIPVSKMLWDSELMEEIPTIVYTPLSVWKKTTPVSEFDGIKFIETKPVKAYYKRKLKESYEKDGKTIQLIRKDNTDVLGRLKPKTNDQYKAEFKTDHPYLNVGYKDLKDKYTSGKASPKEKVDYENLLFLNNELLTAQEGIEQRFRLGLSVPFMDKSWVERATESKSQDVKSGLKSAIEGLKRRFSRTENDIDRGIITPNSDYAKMATADNNEMKFIPVTFTSKGSIDNASYDVWGASLNYISSINRKKELDKELAFVTGVEQILKDENNQPKSETKNLLINSITKKYLPGLESKINTGGNIRLEVLKSFINSVMFNEEHFEGYDLMGINTQKTVTQLMNLSSFTVLGFAPFNWSVNMLSGQVQNLVEGVAGRIINISSFNKAKRMIYAKNKYGCIIADMSNDFGKLGNKSFWGQMMQVFDPIQGDEDKEFANNTKFHGVKNILHLGVYAGKMWGEWEIQISAFVAFLLNHKLYNNRIIDRESFITERLGDISTMTVKEISDKKIEIIKEFDSLETNLIDLFELRDGKLSIKDNYKDVFDIGSKQFSDIVSKLHSMNKRINGSYAKFDKTYIEKYSLGRMMFYFRRYVIPLGLNRWGDRRVDYEGMQVEEGFYRTFLRTVGKDLLRMRWNLVKNWSSYSDLEKSNIQKTLTDVAVIITCVAIYSFLLGYDTDQDDNMKKLREKPWALQSLVFLLLKVKSETEQFIPLPQAGLAEITRIYSNPSILFTNITKYIKILNLAMLHTLDMLPFVDFSDKLYYEKDGDIGDGRFFLKDEGESKLFANLMSTFLGYTGKTFSPADAIRSFEYTQK